MSIPTNQNKIIKKRKYSLLVYQRGCDYAISTR